MLNIISVSFDYSDSNIFKTLHNVLEYSAKKHEPNAIFRKIRLKEPERNGRVRGFVSNTIKLQRWHQEFSYLKDGDYAILIDADMLIIDRISEIFDYNFDVAYTLRTKSKWPVNGGIFFLKVNDRSRKFMDKFLTINMIMYDNQKFHQEYRERYAGMNQAAFGYILEEEKDIANMVSIPGKIWNSCGEDWENIGEHTKIIHIKGQLRKALFEPGYRIEHELVRPALIWKEYYEAMEACYGTQKR